MDLEKPEDFEWPYPWAPIEDEQECLHFPRMTQEVFGGKKIAPTIVEELKSEIGSEKHPLFNVECQAIAYNTKNYNEFILLTSKLSLRITWVHLTWETEESSDWPAVRGYRSLDEWAEDIPRIHEGKSLIGWDEPRNSIEHALPSIASVRDHQDLPEDTGERIEALMQLLNDNDWKVRWSVVRELYFLEDARVVNVLIDRLKNDPVDSVRLMAAQALGSLHEKGIEIPLFQDIDDGSQETQERVALDRLVELGVKIIRSTNESFTLLIPHNLSSTTYIEIGYLMAQLANEPFPKGYSPLVDVPSFVIPERRNPYTEFRESYPHGLKFLVKRFDNKQ